MADDTQDPAVIWVKSTVPTQPDGGDKVVLSETDPHHPGEGNLAWIAGPTPVQVARTTEVERVLREGTAVEVGGPDGSPAKGSKAPDGKATGQPPAGSPGAPTP